MTEEKFDPYAEARMTVLEHLGELRVRVVYAFIAVFVGFCASWAFREEIFSFLIVPLQSANVDSALTEMHHKDLAEPFFALLKTSIFGGIFFTAPILLYQVWAFIGPALYPEEKRFAVPFSVFATLFFVMGAAFCYYLVMPYGYEFLLGFTEVSTPELMMNEYLGLTTKLLLGFGFIFNLPVFTAFFAQIGVIDHTHLIRFWRYAIVLAFIIAAMLTPPDVITQSMMAGPLILLYTISIGVAYVISKSKARKRAAEEEEEEEAQGS